MLAKESTVGGEGLRGSGALLTGHTTEALVLSPPPHIISTISLRVYVLALHPSTSVGSVLPGVLVKPVSWHLVTALCLSALYWQAFHVFAFRLSHVRV